LRSKKIGDVSSEVKIEAVPVKRGKFPPVRFVKHKVDHKIESFEYALQPPSKVTDKIS
jgi:hypothetical protein